MANPLRYLGALAPVLFLLTASSVHAQTYEDVGTRARGMAGAFVAVADDASATWWNPAGLATGALANGIVERGRLTEPRDLSADAPARRATVSGYATAFPAAGISVYHLRISEIAGASATTGSSLATRQDPEGAAASVRSLSLTQLGLTVGQSVGDSLVIGATLKVLRGGVGHGAVDPHTDLLDAADDLSIERQWSTDLDVGAMARFGGAKLGFSVRNVREPNFGEGSDEMALQRQARAGASWTSEAHGSLSAFTLAADADLTTNDTSLGEVRRVAFGGEVWFANRRLGLRSGVSHNTREGGASATSGGASLGLTKNFFLDAAVASGSDRTLRGWSGSARFTY